ncbi:MFS transporter [Aurantimonas sp. Leaf443]|uniref:MFS transporter n=1 Tax=Aurantimonas sp. Leaf443 TaxID=1736378 RepID=UPI0007000196|nr:MFS transporter [Aurantimonas sp. Leaf443]KQT88261.1 MFS transporter [Aurantimonas sp. Leaf443]
MLLPIVPLLTSTFFLMAGAGLMGILLPVRGTIEGWSSYQVGLFGTGYALAFTLGCLVVPRIVRQVGHIRTFSCLSSLLATSILLCGLLVDPIAWVAFRALAGFALAGSYMVIESWLNERVTNETRGTIFSLYMTVTMAAMMGGQYLMPLADPALPAPFMLCAAFFALAVIPTAISSAQSPRPLTSVTLDLKSIFRNSPAAAIGVLCAGVLSSSWGNMAPVFAQKVGLSTTQTATLAVAAMAGGVAFQMPLGRLSDRLDRRSVMVIAGLVGVLAAAVAALLMPRAAAVLFALAFVLGGIIYPAYSLAVAHANDFAGKENFVQTSSGLLILYGFGTMIGPVYAAAMMESFGPHALFEALGSAMAVYAAYALWRTFRREAKPASERPDFRTSPIARVNTPQTFELDPRAAGEGEDGAKAQPAIG